MPNSYTPGVRHIFDYLNVIRREEPAYDESFDSGDLSRYTEAKFFDFDMGQPGEDMVVKKDVGVVEPAIASVDLGMKGGEMEFLGMATTFHPRISKMQPRGSPPLFRRPYYYCHRISISQSDFVPFLRLDEFNRLIPQIPRFRYLFSSLPH